MKRIEKDKYDTDAWVDVLAEAQKQNMDKCRPTLEKFLKIFPTAVNEINKKQNKKTGQHTLIDNIHRKKNFRVCVTVCVKGCSR